MRLCELGWCRVGSGGKTTCSPPIRRRGAGTCMAAPPAPPRSREAGEGEGVRVLPRVVDRPRLADDGDLDRPGVLHPLFDLLGHVARQAGGRQVVDILRRDDDPDLPPGLQGEALLNSHEGIGDLLQTAHAFNVLLQTLAPRPRPGAADSV